MRLDYIKLAHGVIQHDFVSANPFFFLIGTDRLQRMKDSGSHTAFDSDTNPSSGEPGSGGESTFPLVLPVRKIQSTFPSMITVGRTSNNDLVIDDVRISRLHAFFRNHDGVLTLTDAGSHHGTYVNKTKIGRTSAQPIRSGDSVRFASLVFVAHDAHSCWEHLRRL